MPGSDKPALRKQYLRIRDQMSPTRRAELDLDAFQKIRSLPAFFRASSVLLFASFGSEPQTDRLFREALRLGIPVAFPVCSADRSMRFFRTDRPEALTGSGTGAFSFRVPDPSCPELIPDAHAFCLVPGLVFDHSGYRIGYGGGYYDRFLAENSVYSASIVYPELLCPEPLPRSGFDVPVRHLIIPDVPSAPL